MKLQQAKYSCYACGNQFKAAELAGGAYGDFLLRNAASGEMRYLGALSDRTYDEVDEILLKSADCAGQGVHERAKILREIYGAVAGDSDVNGNFYELGRHPRCPSCSASTVGFVESVEPPEFIDVDIPPVTHSSWNALSLAEKTAVVSGRLTKLKSAYFSERDLGLIEALQYDPDLAPSYESIKSCLVWDDERADNLTPDGYEKLCDLWIARSFVHQRRPFSSWWLAPDHFEKVWADANAANFNWPGFKRLVLREEDREYLNTCLEDENDI
jgi:hypothetical protein